MSATAFHIPTLETPRLTLRAPCMEDLGSYSAFNAESDLRVGKYRGGKSDAEIVTTLSQDIAHWEARGFGMWLIVPKDDSKVIGGVGITHPDDWPSHELTWWLMPSARSHGYATEASRAVLSWAFEVLDWPTVETHFRDENSAARRMAERLGGHFLRRQAFPDGVTRDVFAFDREAA